MHDLLWFTTHYRGKAIGPPYGPDGSSLALIRAYLNLCYGVQMPAIAACDWRDLQIPGFTWCPQHEGCRPVPGSIIVWAPTGSGGSVPDCTLSICIDVVEHTVLCFDQGHGSIDRCHHAEHDGKWMQGWHTPPLNREGW